MIKHFNSFLFSEKLNQNPIIKSIRSGLIFMIPVLLIGSIALTLKSFPINIYQEFITDFQNGILINFFEIIYQSTFGLLSLYMAITVSINYFQYSSEKLYGTLGCVISSISVFALFSGFGTKDFNISSFGAKGIFIAVISALLSTKIYSFIIFRNKKNNLYSDGADSGFNNSIKSIFPSLIVTSLFAVINEIIKFIFSVNCIYDLFIKSINSVFENISSDFLSGFLFVLISSILWFFGIHGSDVLEGVSQHIFQQNTLINETAYKAGQNPELIFTKEFFDIFVLMGGCGTAICLFIALLLFSKHKSNRKLSKMAFFPMIFNINEILIFGLPIVFNPIFLIPFILTPLVTFMTSFFAISLGLVPATCSAVTWTTPIIFGGYIATKPIAGCILQIINIIIGVIIYAPFVKLCDKQRKFIAQKRLDSLIKFIKDQETINSNYSLLNDLPAELRLVAQMLISDLNTALQNKDISIYYQPQYNQNHTYIGAEALLRWNHPDLGFIYPPLVIKIAEEGNILENLEKYIITKTAEDSYIINKNNNNHISVNVSFKTFSSDNFLPFIKDLCKKYPEIKDFFCIEISENSALNLNMDIKSAFKELHNLGIKIAIDDFSMGNTSLKYLQETKFDIVKLDGKLTSAITDSIASREIISSIVYLSKSLNFSVIAEYVETLEQKNLLEKLGCNYYQGYLYSPAVTIDELINNINKDV